MKNLVFISILLLSLSQFGKAQIAMDEGFAMLETQAYHEAVGFFGNILDKEPENKTARICYGRAVGLGGDTNKGLEVFKQLKDDFPQDFEVKLNLAEALMWKKAYAEAYEVYEQLLQTDSTNYVANLGFANANASLKNNAQALRYINRAIKIDSENQGAITSRKYILLALADDARKVWDYNLSHTYLDQVLLLYPNDKDGLLNKATVHLSDQKINSAELTFQQILDLDLAPIDALMGLSYTSLLKGKNKRSLGYAQEAVDTAIALKVKPDLYLRAAINEVNALAINKKFSEAEEKLYALKELYPDDIQVPLAIARIKVWNKKEKEGLALYKELTTQYPESFELRMGIAEAYRSLKERNKAINYVEKALEVQNKQPDAFRLLQELHAEGRSVLTIDGARSSDVGGNDAQEGNIYFDTGFGDKHRAFIQYHYRDATQNVQSLKSNQQVLMIGDNWVYSSRLRLHGSIGKVFASGTENSQNSTLLNLGANLNFLKHHEIGFKYGREAHNYTVDLINSGIIMNNLLTSYSFQSNLGVGLYSHYLHTFQTDGNKRDILFSSLYYNIKNSPLFKVGVNLSKVMYDQEASELYFSPSDLRTGEVFFESSNFTTKSRLNYRIFVAVGKQKIEDQEVQSTKRVEFSLGYQLSPALQLESYYTNSNAAQGNAIGFSHTRYGIKLRSFF